MLLKTHVVGGLIAGEILVKAMSNSDFGLSPQPLFTTFACLFLSVIGSILPDIDLHNSTAGNKIAPASWLIQLFVGHRTFFHSPFFVCLSYFALVSFFPYAQPLILACCVGMASHIILDSLNKAGIPLLWPLPIRFWAIGIKAGSIMERSLGLGLAGLSIIMMLLIILE